MGYSFCRTGPDDIGLGEVLGSAAPDRLGIAPATPSSNKLRKSQERAAGKVALILDSRFVDKGPLEAPLSRALRAEDKEPMDILILSDFLPPSNRFLRFYRILTVY